MNCLLLFSFLTALAALVSYGIYFFAQKERLHQIGLLSIAVCFILLSVEIAFLLKNSGYLPAQYLSDALIIIAWSVCAIYLILYALFKLRIIGFYVALLVAPLLLLSLCLPDLPTPIHAFHGNSILFTFHILTVFWGAAAMALACGTGLLYLVQEQAIKQHKIRGFFFRRLPSLELLDLTGYGCLLIGFSLLTLGLVSGFVFAYQVSGHFWNWAPKEIWSVFAWIVYAILVHGRILVGWRGRKAAIMSLVGFVLLLLTFLGLNFL